jgi:hypothetical protein
MLGVFTVTCLFSLLPSAIAATTSYFVDDEPEWLALRESSPGTKSLALLPASPDCWLDAIQALKIHTGSVLEDKFHGTSSDGESRPLTSVTCSWLTASDQKILALELSKCHLRDLDRPLFQFDTEEEHKACDQTLNDYSKAQEEVNSSIYLAKDQSMTSRNIATKCLARLTDAGVNSYTHFFSYVNQLCTRLLSEFVLGQYYETSYHLARSSKVAEGKIQSLIEQQDLLFRRWTEREDHHFAMYDQLESRVEKQAIGLESKIGRLRMNLEEEHEHWKKEYAVIQENLAKELERHQREFAFFSGIVHKIQDSVTTWSTAAESLWKNILVGHTISRGMFLTVGGVLSCWVLTIPGPLRWMRSFMVMFLVMGLMAEMAVLVTISQEGETSNLWRNAYLMQCDTIRSWLFNALIGYFTFGVLRSIFRVCKSSTVRCEGSRVEPIGHEETHVKHCLATTVENEQCKVNGREDASTIAPRQNNDPKTPSLYQQPMAASTFHPSVLLYGTTRTFSNDDLAAETDVSQGTPEPRLVTPHSISMAPNPMYTQLYLLTPPPTHNSSIAFTEPVVGLSPSKDVGSLVAATPKVPLTTSQMTSHLNNTTMSVVDMTRILLQENVDSHVEEHQTVAVKRPLSNLSEEAREEYRPTKRSRYNGEDNCNNDSDGNDDMNVEANVKIMENADESGASSEDSELGGLSEKEQDMSLL